MEAELPPPAADVADVDAALLEAEGLMSALVLGPDLEYSISGDAEQEWKARAVAFVQRHLTGTRWRKKFDRGVNAQLLAEVALGDIVDYVEKGQDELRLAKSESNLEKERKEKEKERKEKEKESEEKEKEREEKEAVQKTNVSLMLEFALTKIAEFTSSSKTVDASALMGETNPPPRLRFRRRARRVRTFSVAMEPRPSWTRSSRGSVPRTCSGTTPMACARPPPRSAPRTGAVSSRTSLAGPRTRSLSRRGTTRCSARICRGWARAGCMPAGLSQWPRAAWGGGARTGRCTSSSGCSRGSPPN